MKAILEFILPEELEEFTLAINANKYFCALDDIRNLIRERLKYSEEESITHSDLSDKFWEILKENEAEL